MPHFDVIVIGKGLLGSAAAKYLSATSGSVAIIGPDEPEAHEHGIVYASHYDQARVQRLIGKDAVWTRLNVASAQQYDAIRARSGLDFHNPAGCLYVNPYGRDSYLEAASSLAGRFNLRFTPYANGPEIADDFRDFHFPETAQGLWEPGPSGYINPRKLIQAQLRIFEAQQGIVFRETVSTVNYSGQVFQVLTHEGNTYRAAKILLAAGAFVNFFDLIPQKPDLQLKSEVVLLARVSDAEAKRLATLPSLLYETDTGDTEGIYLIQPVRYPDGAWYLKMGCNMPEDQYFERIAQVREWFRYGNSDRFLGRLTEALSRILPDITVEGYLTKRCIISRSAHGRPYIGATGQPGLYLAGGCNGYSAMCSDGIGSVAAQVVSNDTFPEGFTASDFEIGYQT